jgi:hypothetical protein
LELILEKTTVWDDILGLIREQINSQIFDTWFLPIRFVGLDADNRELQLSAGDATIDWVEQFYSAF